MKTGVRPRFNEPQLLLGGLALSLLVGALAALNPAFALVPIGLCAGFIIIRFPVVGLYLLFLGVFFLDWFARVLQVIPSASRYLTDGVLALLLVAALLRLLSGAKRLRRTPLDAPLLGLVVIGIISALGNNDPWLLTLAGFRTLFKPILLFYILVYLDLNSQTLKRLIYFLIALGLFQIPVMLVQVRLYGGGGDFVTGTLGYFATGPVTIVALSIMALLYGQAVAQSKKGRGVVFYGALGASLFIPIILGEAKAGFFMAPLMLLYLFSGNVFRYLTRVRTWLLIILFVGIFFIGVQLMPTINPRSQLVQFLQSPERIITEYDRPLEKTEGAPMSRLGDLQFAWQLVAANPFHLLFGFGPAQSVETTFLGVTGELRQTHDLGIFLGFHQLSRTLLEWGLAGLLTYLFAILAVYRAVRSRFKRGAFDDFWRGVAWGFGGITVLFVLGIYYLPIWETEVTAYIFWTCAAALWTMGARGKDGTRAYASQKHGSFDRVHRGLERK